MTTTILTRTIAKLILVPSLVVAAAILVKGYADAGDGFNAGVVASLGVLVQFLAFGFQADRLLPLRFAPHLALVGLGLGLLVAFVPALLGDPLFTHRPGPGDEVVHVGTIELITPVVFDVSVFLLVFGAAVGGMRFIARALATAEGEPA